MLPLGIRWNPFGNPNVELFHVAFLTGPLRAIWISFFTYYNSFLLEAFDVP
jgi:hypothetical protein